jgi:hypothetical protein
MGKRRGAGDGGGYQVVNWDISLNGSLIHHCTDRFISITRRFYQDR